MIRFRVSLGTEMKRVLLLVLAAMLLLLPACSDDGLHAFTVTDDGRYVDGETDVSYTPLPDEYEASYAGEQLGRYEDEENGYTLLLYAVPDMDSTQFITDENGGVYCAGVFTEAAAWEMNAVLVCDEIGAMDRVVRRFDAPDGAETVAAVRDLWFEGEDLGNVFLLESVSRRYAVKLGSAVYPNIYYALEIRMTEEGGTYLCDKAGRRTVALDAALAAVLCGEDAA